MKLHIRKGDTVKVLSGKDRGAEGRVLVVFPTKRTAIVEGINVVRKHTKPNQQNPNGGILEQEAAIHLSNLMLMENGVATRTGKRPAENGKGWERFSKKSGDIV